MWREMLDEAFKFPLQLLHVGVLCRLVELLKVMHDPADDFGKLRAEDEECGSGWLAKRPRLRNIFASQLEWFDVRV
jgi:hypothetical protein